MALKRSRQARFRWLVEHHVLRNGWRSLGEYRICSANDDPGRFGWCPTTFTAVNSFNRTNTGWVIGGGAEWQATTNILLRAEYLYYNINSGPTAQAPYAPLNAALPLPVNFGWSNYNVQVFRVAGSYKF